MPKLRRGGADVSKPKDKATDLAEREAMFRRFVRLTFLLAGAILLLLALMATFLV